ncbi:MULTISPECIES: hypothetical protein [Bacillus]|uniref:ParB/Sulfiredoxin domain-containing protein n=1 Tax=Bacillus mycoides TaxID=1405 RepID=A0AAP8KWH7_BACMY|nr:MULTISPECIES: hypothetical protein [Bacillus]EJQ85319.1 hypothetical protein IGK_00203 [Bacillus toyonensis]MDA1877396.1 hypothetical protein [Bacillus cereus group sp. BY112LC]PJN61338.1 hypothetical protein BAWEI_39640 [Bacillus mycoides]PJN72243.1 hypothetical protein BACWE_08570 [Bacillus mycoides]QEQ16008.1 hypothetical protein F0362_04895 [Bacillus sp. BS98]
MVTKTKALSEDLRIEKLNEIKQSIPIMTGVKLFYKGQERKFNVYQIPLEYLVYNPYNGRIGTKVKTFEVTSHKLNPENQNDIFIIEQFLWDSKHDRNKKTLKSLLKIGQQEYGIVTKNGYIIDGNRRASLLNKINNNKEEYSKNYDVRPCSYFNAIILDDNVGQKEILQLETMYQMGREEKLDYNATEKYLKCQQLKEVGYSIEEIADMMGEGSSKNIQKYLDILDLMDQYLDYYGYNNMYAMLDKREGQFVDLNNYEKAYKSRSGNAKTNWNPQDDDISEMLQISFDYIRAQYEGKEFRNIAKNGKSTVPQSFFASQKLWQEFRDKHFENVEVIEEDPIDVFLSRANNDEEIIDSLTERDEEWAKKIINPIKENLKYSKSKLENIQEADKPLTLLERAKNALLEIDEHQESLYSEDVLATIKEINNLAYNLSKTVKKQLNQTV